MLTNHRHVIALAAVTLLIASACGTSTSSGAPGSAGAVATSGPPATQGPTAAPAATFAIPKFEPAALRW